MAYESLLNKAIELQNSGALNQAQDIYMQLLNVMPENSDVWNLLGLIAQEQGDFIRARDCFLKAIEYAPTPFFYHYFNLSLIYKSLGQKADALDMVKRAVQLNPEFKEGWNLLGVHYGDLRNTEEAIKAFNRALEIDGNYGEAKANLYFYSNNKDLLFKLANSAPSNYVAQLNAAIMVDDRSLKEKYLRQAIAINDNRDDAFCMLAEVLESESNFNEALTFYHKALNINDKNLQAMLGLADLSLRLERDEEAEKYYLKSFELNSNIAGAHINYGTILYKQKRLNEALEEYRKAVLLSPDKSEISYNLALILKEIGDLEEALGLMFNAFLKEKNNNTYAINIMETLILLYQKDAEKALKIALNWQKIAPDNVFSKRIVAALSGQNDDNNDEAYVRLLFDNFALNYESTLNKLMPKIINKFKSVIGEIEGEILDLGCGTGMVAKELKTEKNRFYGVDISSHMIDVAKLCHQYEALYVDDIEHFLTKHDVSFYDIVLGIDVFCYIGHLESVLSKLQGCKIAFSVEKGDDDRGKDFYLDVSGRYKHRLSYVRKILEKYDFKNINIYEFPIRQENGNNVDGALFLANFKNLRK